jgi:hypothetical protein
MFTALSLICALTIVVVVIPIPDDTFDGGSFMERELGSMPPIWIGVMLVCLAIGLTLLPAVVLGWRKYWFRSALW